jgi:hypothetical protein
VRDEANFTGPVIGQPEINVWLVEPINTDHEPAAPPAIQVEKHSEVDLLAVAIHAVKRLSGDDRAVFDRWYRDTCQVIPGREAIDGDIMLRDDPKQLTLALEHSPEQDEVKAGEVVEDSIGREKSSTTPERVLEPDVVEVEDDPLVAMWRELKVNSQKCARAWVLNGGPAEVSSSEHFLVTERLAPWRNAYRDATPERQQTTRQWLETQRQ